MKPRLIILAGAAALMVMVMRGLSAHTVILAWDHSPDITNHPGSIFYRIYHQTNVPPTTNFTAINVTTFDVGTNAWFAHTNLNMAVPNVWAVTAVGTSNGFYRGLESDFSNWISYGPFSPPQQVTGVRMRP